MSNYYLDPEIESMVASSLIETRRPHRHVYAVYEVGVAGLIAGVILLLLSASGSTTWTPAMVLVDGRNLLTTAVLSVTLSLVGALTAIVSALWLKYVL